MKSSWWWGMLHRIIQRLDWWRLCHLLPWFYMLIANQHMQKERERVEDCLGDFYRPRLEMAYITLLTFHRLKVAQLLLTKREAGKYGVVEGPGEKGIRSVEWVASLCHSSLFWQPISASCFFPHSLHHILRETTQTLLQSLHATQVPEFPGDTQFFPS